MSTDRQPTDARGLRVALLLAAASLAAVLVAVAMQALAPEWKAIQQRFRDLHRGGRSADGIQQIASCSGELDRCATCHLGIERPDLANESVALPFRAHSRDLSPHPVSSFGCSACHGGNGRALDPLVAHRLDAIGERDPLMREPQIQASCARCHVPGDAAGMERLVRGAELYLGLGCAVCHPLTEGGRGGWDYGPDLTAIGRRSPAYLETSLLDPAANFPDSTMPSFKHALEHEPEARVDLLIYLQSLVLPRGGSCSLRARSNGLLALPCASCHAGEQGRAAGRLVHRCLYLKQRADELRCARCHGEGVPRPGAGKGRCPTIEKRRGSCTACHDRVEG